MLCDLARIEPANSWSPVGRASDWATEVCIKFTTNGNPEGTWRSYNVALT